MKQSKLVAVLRCAGLGCEYGCTFCAKCAEVCAQEAFYLHLNKLAAVDRERCDGCGKCVGVCPQGIIEIVPRENVIQNFCSSRASAKNTRAACGVGCIGCGICEKVCPVGAVRVVENRAVIDQARCIACGMCAVKCPRGVMHDMNGIFAGR